MTENTENLQTENEFRPWNMRLNEYLMLMHLSQFAGYLIPFGGFVMPLVMWLTNRENSELVDTHGKNIMNWIISSVIYAVVGAILIAIIIGIPILIALGVCSIIFTIIGAVRANQGIVYAYPLSITFFR